MNRLTPAQKLALHRLRAHTEPQTADYLCVKASVLDSLVRAGLVDKTGENTPRGAPPATSIIRYILKK